MSRILLDAAGFFVIASELERLTDVQDVVMLIYLIKNLHTILLQIKIYCVVTHIL